MGIYYHTRFYNNISNKKKFVVLSNIDPIIDRDDDVRGYVRKEDLLQYYGKLVKDEDISNDSRIVEYMTTTLEPNVPIKEEKSLPIM